MTPDRRASVARKLVPVARLVASSAAVGALLFAIAAVALADSPAPAASGAPGAGGGQTGGGGPGASGGPAISIIGTTFQPADLTIQAGQTVTWTVTQAVGAAHSVTSGLSTDTKPGTVFDSGIKLQNNGDSFSYTFASAGSFPYFCAVHPTTMHGTITVEAAAGAGGPSSPDPGASKLVTAAILAVAIVLLFGWARVYRRMNPA